MRCRVTESRLLRGYFGKTHVPLCCVHPESRGESGARPGASQGVCRGFSGPACCRCGSRALRAFRNDSRGHTGVRASVPWVATSHVEKPPPHPSHRGSGIIQPSHGDKMNGLTSHLTSVVRHAAPRPLEQTTHPQDGCARAGRSPEIHRALHQAPGLYPSDRNLIQAGFWK